MADANLEAATPFAVETFGQLGPAALELLNEARQRTAARDQRMATWANAGLAARWFARIACARANGLFEAARAVWGETGPHTAAFGPPGPLLAAVVDLCGR